MKKKEKAFDDVHKMLEQIEQTATTVNPSAQSKKMSDEKYDYAADKDNVYVKDKFGNEWMQIKKAEIGDDEGKKTLYNTIQSKVSNPADTIKVLQSQEKIKKLTNN